MKVFLDSNIILDFLDHARPTHEDAKQIIHHLIMNDIETYLSEDMLTVKIGVIRTANRNMSGHCIGTNLDSISVDIRTLESADRYVRTA